MPLIEDIFAMSDNLWEFFSLKGRIAVITGAASGIGRETARVLAVLYLASGASRFMTGQIMRPNGGVAMP
jgi:hypothetical protein